MTLGKPTGWQHQHQKGNIFLLDLCQLSLVFTFDTKKKHNKHQGDGWCCLLPGNKSPWNSV